MSLDRSITSGDSAKKPAEDSPRIVDSVPAHPETESHAEPQATTYEGSVETWVKADQGGTESRPLIHDLEGEESFSTAVADSASVTVLPDVIIEDSPAMKAALLSPAEVDRRARELFQAVNRYDEGYIFGIGSGDDPDLKKIRDILDPLNEADRKAIETAYRKLPGNENNPDFDLRGNLKEKLEGDDFREFEAILNRRDGRTNDAGALMLSLNHIDNDRDDAERRVLEVFSTLDRTRMDKLEQDFKADYGMTIDQALEQYGLSKEGRTAVDFLRTPAEERTEEQIKDFARFAVEEGSLDYLLLALRGDSPQAQAARESLKQDEGFKQALIDEFKPPTGFLAGVMQAGDFALGPIDEAIGGAIEGDLSWGKVLGGISIVEGASALKDGVDAKDDDIRFMMAMDALNEGRISLSTIALNNTGSLFGWFDNKENIGLAVEGATDAERRSYTLGRSLSESGREPESADERQALEYFKRIDKAFRDSGDNREALHWDAVMRYGKDSLLADITSKEDTTGRFESLEGLREADWSRLRAEGGEHYREDIRTTVEKLAGKAEADRMLEILDGKVDRANSEWTFDDSRGVHRSLFETIEQNKNKGFFSWGYREDGVLEGFERMTAEEAKRYKDDPAFKKMVDDFAEDTLNGQRQVYARMLLDQVARTGEAPDIERPAETVLKDRIDNKSPEDSMAAVESLLSDPAVRERLNKPYNELSKEDRFLRSAVDSVVRNAYENQFGPDPAVTAAMYGQGMYIPVDTAYSRKLETFQGALLERGSLSASEKAELGLKDNRFFEQTAALDPEARAAIDPHLSDAEKKLIDAVAENPDKKMTLSDRIYASAVLGKGPEAADFEDALVALRKGPSGEARIQELREDYGRKYDRNFDTDFLGSIDKDDRGRFRDLITASTVDYRQTHYEAFALARHSESGVSVDATELTVDRTLTIQADMLRNLQHMFEHPEDYPEEDREKLREASRVFAKAIEDYRESKEKFAEGIYQTAVLVGGLSVAVATGGVAAGPLLAVALTSAAGRIALKRGIQGTDYELNPENLFKDAIIGAATGGFSVLGPETIAGIRGVGTLAWGRVGTAVADRGLGIAFKEGAEGVAGKELTNLIGGSVSGRVGKEAVESLAQKLVANPDDAARLVPVLQEVIEQSGREVTENILKQSFPELVRQNGFIGGVRALGTELRAASPEIAAKLPGMAKGVLRESAVNAALGGSSNVLIEGSVGLAKDGQLDLSKLGESFLVGAGAGATLTVAFKGAITLGKPVIGIAGNVARNQFDNVDGFAAQFARGADGKIKVSAPEGAVPFKAEVKLASGETRIIELGAEPVDLPDGTVSMGIPGGRLTEVHAQVATADGEAGDLYALHPANADGVPERSVPTRVDDSTKEYVTRGEDLPMREVTRTFSRRVLDALGMTKSGDKLDFRYVNGTPVKPNNVVTLGRHGDIRWSGSADEISRKHAYYYVDESGNAFIQDAGSTNGTYVNGTRIREGEWVQLKPSDKVNLGKPEHGHELHFRADSPRAAVRRLIERTDLPEGVLLRPRDYVPESPRTFRESIDQSNYFGTNSELAGRIRDGYIDAGKGTRVGADGKLVGQPRRHMIAVDRANDPVLRNVIEDARTRFGHLSPAEKAAALNTYVHELIGAPNMSGKQLDAWHDAFGEQNKGEPVLLGEFIRQGKGVCIEQATLMKVLADELGLEATLVRGAGEVGDPTINHAWVHIRLPGQDEPLVYDPRWREAGVRYSQIDAHERGIEIINHGRDIPVEPHAPRGGRIEVFENGAPIRVGSGSGNALRLTEGSEVTVGRNFEGTVDRAASKYDEVSGVHGKLFMRNGQLFFKDVSSNGTYINGDRLTPGREVPINLSDDIHLGSPDGPRLRLIKEQRPIEVGPGGLAGDLREGGSVMIGRDHSGSVPLNHPEFKKVSGNHGRLSMKDGQLYFQDVSSNGTYINGVKVERGKDFAISSADDIRLGSPDGPRLEFRERDRKLLYTRVTRGAIDIEADSLILERGDGGVDAEALERVIRQIKSSNKSEFPKMPVKDQPGLETQSLVLDHMERRLKRLQDQGKIGTEWVVMPTEYHSAADMAGADGLLVNTKTGEVHIIDPTGNLQKAQNGRGNNVAAMNEHGVVYGPRPIFDESGTLRYDADPTETVRIDGEEVSLKEQVDRFRADVDNTLYTLTGNRSPLTLSDFSGSIRNQPVDDPARLLRDFETMLRERAADPEYADFRQGLIGFADNIRDGALNYASRVGREIPPTPPLKDYLDGYAERVMLDHALADLKVRDLNVPSNPERSADVRVIKGTDGDASLKLEHENGSIYNVDSINTMLKSAQIRLTNEVSLKNMLLSKPFSGKMKALRAKYPNLDDDQIVRKVREAISNVDYRYGLHLANRRADHPVVTMRNRLADSDAWQRRIEELPAEAPPKPKDRVTENGFSSADVEKQLKELWTDQVQDIPQNAEDLHDYLFLLREQIEPSLSTRDLNRLDDMIASLESDDPEAVAALLRILQ